MALTPVQARQALIALQRFGLGPKAGGGLDAIGTDAKAALRFELNEPGIAAIDPKGLPTAAEAAREGTYDAARAEVLRREETAARLDKHLSVRIGFVERLVLFWSNHFSMLVNKNPIIRATIGQVERHVIRKHVLGNFADMLVGVSKSQAMLCYLDNAASIGPNSPAGKANKQYGYNENLAREIFELHTMGRDGKQTQDDIKEFSLALTGWSFVLGEHADKGIHGGTQANRGQYMYRPLWHEPGPRLILGKTYPAVGERQAELVMREVAAHPATAAKIAFKLVKHFVADDPTPEMTEPLRNAYLNSDGNLKVVALALLNLPQAWSQPLNKIRTPYELCAAKFRALGYRLTDEQYPILYQILSVLSHAPWEAPMPTGYSDHSRDWLNPDGVMLRVDASWRSALALGRRFQGSVATQAQELFGQTLSVATRESIASAGPTAADALTVLFTSPEFQRR
jgi:uncharacterized protein (DUF1800 family)